METSGHLQHHMPPSWSAAHVSPGHEHRTDRTDPVATALLTGRSYLVHGQSADPVARLTLDSELLSLARSGAVPNGYSRAEMLVHGKLAIRPARNGLAAWQQVVLPAYIEKHIGESIRIRALARFVYLSPDCFCRAFKQSFGMSPHRYVAQQRIERAKALLTGSTWSVTDIGVAVGFRQRRSFSAAFRHVTGSSPSEYRGRWR
jgi:AraC-like DNA-binding protein